MGDRALHAAFNFDFLQQPFRALAFQQSITSWENVLGQQKWPNYVLNNHDNPRSTTRYRMGEDDRKAKLAAFMLLTLRGTPFLYYGEEIGMRDIHLSRHEILDPPGRKYWPFYVGRDGCRSPMQWNGKEHAGFSESLPWLPVHPDYLTRNVENQSGDPDSLLCFYQNLLRFRKENPVLQNGNWNLQVTADRNLMVYDRQNEEDWLRIVLNFNSFPATYSPGIGKSICQIVFSTSAFEEGVQAGIIELKPYQGMILRYKVTPPEA
jgi:alpha-glucosidase